MQKSIVEDNKDINSLSDKVASETLNKTMGKPKSAAMLAHELLAANKADEAEVTKIKNEYAEKIAALEAEIKKLKLQRTQAERHLTREESADVVDPEKIAAIKKRGIRLSSDINKAQRKLTLAQTDRDADIEKAEKKFRSASARQSRKTRAEQGVSTKKLQGINPLIIPVKSAEIGPGKLTFSQMSAVAHREGYAEGTQDLIAFDDAINGLNAAIGFRLPDFQSRIDKKNPIFSDPGVRKIFSSIKPDDTSIGQIEKSADLIKIFWLYLGGDEVFSQAKSSENFINALTKLEKSDKNPVTKPIIQITSSDDVFASEPVKEVFGYFKHFIENHPQNIIKSIIVPEVESIINAPDALYNGFSTTTSENVADTLYYTFIDTFGTPEDKVLLLKRMGTSGKKGLKGSSAYFLAQPAIDALNLKVKDLARVAEDEKMSEQKGRHTSWGTRNVNSQYEKYMGGKVLGAMGGKYLTTKPGTDVEEENLLDLIGKVFDITRPVNAGYALSNQIEELKTQLKAATNPTAKELEDRSLEFATDAITEAGMDPKKELAKVTKDPRVIEILKASRVKAVDAFREESRELQKELSELSKQNVENASQVLVDIRKLFLNGSPEEILAQVKQMFQSRFNAVRQTLTEDLEALKKKADSEVKLGTQRIAGESQAVKSPVEVKIEELSGALSAADKYMADFLTSLDKLQKSDIEVLANVFKSSVHPEENKESKTTLNNKISTKTGEGKLISSWVRDIIDALSKYEVQVPGTIGKDQTEIGYEKRIDGLFKAAKEVEAEIDVLEKKQQFNKLDDAGLQELEALVNEAGSLRANLKQAEDDLKEYKAELVKMGKGGVSTTGDKRLANIYKIAFTSLLYNEGTDSVRSSINIVDLRKLLTRMPQDVFKYLDPIKTSKATAALDIVDPSTSTEASAQTTAWKKSVRKALHSFFNHINTSEVKEDAERANALKIISVPFTSELESTSDYDELDIKPGQKDEKLIDLEGEASSELTDEGEQAALLAKIKRLKRQISKNQKSGKSSEKDKKALRRLEKGKKSTEGLLSFEPGSVLGGHAVATTDSGLATFLLDNAKNLEANARSFYNDILSTVNNLGLVNALYAKENPFSEDNSEFVDAVIALIQKYKATLSTDAAASDLEDSMFLNKLVQSGEIKVGGGGKKITPDSLEADVDSETVRKEFLNQDSFIDFLDTLKQTVADNSIWYEKKVISAPVVENLNLKSATLLNMMSCIKNFDSIEAFDLSENRRNKNVLAEILDIKNYPKSFTRFSSTALMMKLYFLMSLKQSIDRVNVIGQFSEEFITNDIVPDKTDKKIEAILAKLDTANAVFERTILREFEEDFAQGGNLDKEIKENLDILWELASSTANNIYSIKDGALNPVSVTKDTLVSTIMQQGVECIGAFNAEMLKKDTVILNLLTLFDRNKSEIRDAKLQQCISIIKTGINFYVGFEARKIIAEHQYYDKENKQKDIQKFNETMSAYYDNPQFAAFTSSFATKVNTDPTLPYQSTTKVATQAKEGFMNLNNAFLMAFLKDFAAEAITKSVAALDVEQAELADPTSEKAVKADEAVEKSLPVFVSGIFKKQAGTVEEDTLGLDTEEAQKKIDKIIKSNLKKTEKLLATGKVETLSPINVSSEGEGDKKVLKLAISVRQEGGYSKVRPEEEAKRLGASKSGDSLRQLKSFEHLVKMFADSLAGPGGISDMLQLVYSTDAELVAEIKAYSDSIAAAAPNVIKALATITVSENTYNKEMQEASINLLSEIKALNPPDPEAVGELTSPTTTYNKALKSFDDDSIFTPVYSFAQDAAADIERRKISMTEILSIINKVLAGDPEVYKNAKLPTSLKNTGDTNEPAQDKLLNADEIEKYAKLLFTSPLTKEAINNILNSIKKSLTAIPKPETDEEGTPLPVKRDPTETYKEKIESIESEKKGKESQLDKIKQIIGTLETAVSQEIEAANVKPVEKVRPTNQAPFAQGPLTPEDQAATKQRMDAYFAGVPAEKLPTPGEYLSTTLPPKVAEPEDGLTEDVNNWAPAKPHTSALQDRLNQARGDLAKLQTDIAKLETELETLRDTLKRIEEKQSVVAMVEFLSTLYSNGVTIYNTVKKEITDESVNQVRRNLYKIKFTPIKTAVPVIITFIKRLKAEDAETPVAGVEPKAHVTDAVLSAFVQFNVNYIVPFTPEKEIPKEIKENANKLAVYKFNLLLEELEQVPAEDPTTVPEPIALEPIETSAYILGIARFLKEHGFSVAQRWIATNPADPSQTRPGVEGSIQDACMIRFLGNSTGKLNDTFRNFKYCLNSRTFVGFTADIGNTRTEKQGDAEVEVPIRNFVPVQFTKFNLLSKVASGDVDAINSIINPKSDEDE
jgi:hypothetical protein